MADLNAILNNIATAVYGEQVRGSIYDGIKFIHDEYNSVKDVSNKANDLINTYDEKKEEVVQRLKYEELFSSRW